MKVRRLGSTGLQTSAIGLGCMGMSGNYGVPDDAESMRTLARAVELGITLFDTADAYGRDGANERLIAPFVRAHRDGIVLATTFGFVHHADGSVAICGRPDYVRNACDASLARLGVDVIGVIARELGAIVPIPGTKRVRFIEEDAGAAEIALTEEHLARIEAVAPPGVAAGGRISNHSPSRRAVTGERV
jgi:aryl-alcohol dehydrogenase-like predicted oxidoreductase